MPSSAVADGVPGSRGHPEAVPVGRGWGGAGSLSQRLGEGAAHSHGSHGARRGALGTLCHPGGRSASFPDAGFAVGCRTRGAGACGEQQDPSLAGCWLPSQPHCPLQTPLAWPCRATNCQGGTDFLPCARPRGQRGDLACPVPPAAPTQPAVGPQDPCVPRGFLAGEEATSPSWGNQGGKRKRRWLPAPCDSAGTRVPSPEGRRCRCLPPRVWDPWGAGLGGATGLCLPEEQRAPRDFPTPPHPACPEPPAAMPVTVTLAGPAPWGFRLTGGRDFGKPITVSKVTEHGKAAAGDLRPGDIIIAINGESTAEMLNVEAQNKIKQSPGQLQLQVERSLMPPPSHTNGDTSPDRLATRFQDTLQMQEKIQGTLRASYSSSASLSPPAGSSQPLQEELTSPSLHQERGSLIHQNSPLGSELPPPPRPPSPGFGAPPDPWETCRERRRSSHCPSPCNSLGSEPAMRRLEEDSEVYKMLQENRELRAAPRQSSTFRLLQEALEDEGGAGPAAPFPSRLSPSARKPVAGVQKLHVCEKCGSTIATQAVRIQDGRYRHPSCYACADCGLNLKMRGHFWVGDELYCEKHARLRYQGGPSTPAVSQHS